jgi:polyisoprenoid-binding protein YceI
MVKALRALQKKSIKYMKKYLLVLLCALIFTQIHAQKALILKKYFIEYTVKNAGFKSSGRFDNVTADVVFDENNLAKSRIVATIQTNSFNSGNSLKDKHLKDKDYFDVNTYPTIRLASSAIVKKDNGYMGTFDLTIKGITKTIQLPFSVTKNGSFLDFKATELYIDRTAYGVGKSNFTLSNTVNIAINASFSN